MLQSAICDRDHPDQETALGAQAQSHFTRDDSGHWTTHLEKRFGLVIADEAHRAKKKLILCWSAPCLTPSVTTASFYSHPTLFPINLHIHLTWLSFNPFPDPVHNPLLT